MHQTKTQIKTRMQTTIQMQTIARTKMQIKMHQTKIVAIQTTTITGTRNQKRRDHGRSLLLLDSNFSSN